MSTKGKRSLCSLCKGCGTATQETVRDFGEVTTLHGVRYVTEPQSPVFIRLCWGVAILLCAVFCGFKIIKLYTRWQESPVITVLAQKPTHVTSVPFPAVTICPGNKVLRSAFDISKNYDQLLNFTTSNDSEKEQNILAESVFLICNRRTSDFKFNYSIEPTYDHIEMISQISPNINNLFEECIFQAEERNCSELFRPIFTSRGLCFTFNMLSTEEIFNEKYVGEEKENKNIILKNSSWNMEHGYESRTTNFKEDLKSRDEYPFREHTHLGSVTGLMVLLKSNVSEVQDSCATNKNGLNFLVTLHSPHEFPLPDRKHFYISPDSMVMVEVDPEQLIADDELRPPRYTPEIRGCHFPEERPGFILKNLTEQNCLLDSILEALSSNCNCSQFPWTIKGKDNEILPYCAETEEACSVDAEQIISGCLPSCYEINYNNYQISTSRFKWDKTNTSEENIKYTYLKVFFKKASFFAMKKSELYGTTDFIANCGGLLGLFTGFSVISAIEIFYFVTLRFFCKLRESQRKTKKDTEDADAKLNGTLLQS